MVKKKKKFSILSIFKCGGGGHLVTKSCPTLATPWTVASQAPLPMGFYRQAYWNELPVSSPILSVQYSKKKNIYIYIYTQIYTYTYIVYKYTMYIYT